MNIERLLTVAEISKATGLSRPTVFGLIQKGYLKRVRLAGLSRKVVVAESEFRRWLTEAGCPVPVEATPAAG